jgi:rod shape-determining protein MreC
MYRRPGRGRLLLLAFVILSILIVTLSFQKDVDGPLEKVRDVATSIVSPIQRGVTVVVRPVRNFFSSLGDLGNLRSENEELEAELAEAEARLDRAENLEQEVQDLRALTDMKPAWFTMESVDAEVIANTAANYKWTVTIDKGSESGILPNMAVVDAKSQALIGKTIDVYDNTASILLLIDPESGVTSDTKEAIGIVKGNGADEDVSLQYVSPEERVKVGETVSTSGKDVGVFPPGIPIGEVSYVGDDGSGIEQVVEVEPFVTDFNDLQFVKILLDSGPELQAKGGDK